MVVGMAFDVVINWNDFAWRIVEVTRAFVLGCFYIISDFFSNFADRGLFARRARYGIGYFASGTATAAYWGTDGCA